MDRIRVFISYSSKQKLVGGFFKQLLMSLCGYETFIAHDDIQGSSIWEDEIIKAIKESDFFIPLISQEFKLSDFTDQEVGIAVCEGTCPEQCYRARDSNSPDRVKLS